MQTITVDKAKLLLTLQENRDKHRELFLEAQRVFREQVVTVLDRNLAQARAGGKIELFVSLPQPQDYTSQFDRAISMVEWAEGDQIDLSEKDFQRYVLNDWEWAQAFASTTMNYVSEP